MPQKKNIVRRDLSAFVEERFNGFAIVRRLTENEKKELYTSIGIFYKPVSKINQVLNCCFTTSIRNAYRAVSHLKKGRDIAAADQCDACNKFFVQKKSLENHLKTCSSMPGIIYKFENQNIQTFFDNTKCYGRSSICNLLWFELTSGKEIYNFDDDCTFYPVSYAFVVAFHPKLDIEKIFVVRSFKHTLEQLNDVSYLADEMLPYFDPITARETKRLCFGCL